MLDKAATFEHCNLCEIATHLHAHQVATNGFTVALLAASALDQLGISADNSA
jgi:hypothetical protein